MQTCGGGLADQLSKEFQELANMLRKMVDEKLRIGAVVTQKIKKRIGQSSSQKSRILAITETNMLFLLKPADKKEKLKVKGKFLLRKGLLKAGSGSSTVELQADEDVIIFSMATEAERDFFLAACSRGHRKSMARVSMRGLDAYSPMREDWAGAERCQASSKNNLLTSEDYDILSSFITDDTNPGNTDIRQLKERVATATTKAHLSNSLAIIEGEKEWSDIIKNLEDMALLVSAIQAPTVQMHNNIGNKSESIRKVEQERAVHDRKRANYEALESELNFILTSIEEAEERIAELKTCNFKSSRFMDTYQWLNAFQMKQLHKSYKIEALENVNSGIKEAKHTIAISLKDHLHNYFSTSGTQLTRTSAKLKKRLRWRSHYKIHNTLLELHPFMTEVRKLGLRTVMDLCRTYSSAFKSAYRQEIINYFTILKLSLQRTKHKPVFYIGEDKKVKALEMLSEMQVGSSVGGSNYAASEVPTLSVARSGVSNASSDEGDEPPSRLTELGIVVYKSGSTYGGSSYAGGSRCGSRNGSISAASDGLGAESYCTTTTAKSGKEKILPHAALIMSLSTAVDITLREHEFLEQFFGLDSTAGSDTELTNMMNDLFGDSGGSANMVLVQLEQTLRYMEKQCDMMCLVAVNMVVAQLKDVLSTRSSFISTLLGKVEKTVKAQMLVWKANQLVVIEKYSCAIKHSTVMPCFLRFGVFINRIVDMLKPVPLEANYSAAQDVIHEILNAMCDSLTKLCSNDQKYGDFFYIKNSGYYITFLEDRKKHASEHMQKILGAQFKDIETWKRRKEEKEKNYIVSTLQQELFGQLLEFVEGVEECLGSHAVQDVALQSRFSYQNVTALLKKASEKNIRQNIDTINSRQNKHFFQHTASEQFLVTQFRNTWDGTRFFISTLWARLENIIQTCYPDLVKYVQCSIRKVGELLERNHR